MVAAALYPRSTSRRGVRDGPYRGIAGSSARSNSIAKEVRASSLVMVETWTGKKGGLPWLGCAGRAKAVTVAHHSEDHGKGEAGFGAVGIRRCGGARGRGRGDVTVVAVVTADRAASRRVAVVGRRRGHQGCGLWTSASAWTPAWWGAG
jgi:hypothetical protein